MTEAEIKELQNKIQIADAATQAYVANDSSFTFHDVAQRTDLSVGEVFSYFDSKQDILDFYYASLVIRYRIMIDEIEGFEEFTLSEKLSNFAYASFDLMREREEFIAKTFRSHVLRRCKKTEYDEKIEDLLRDFIESDSGRAASSDVVLNYIGLGILRKKYLSLVSFWLNDESEDKEVTTELIDKVTGLIQELLYTSVVDRAIDLAKFIYSNDVLSQQFPLWRRIQNSFEIR